MGVLSTDININGMGKEVAFADFILFNELFCDPIKIETTEVNVRDVFCMTGSLALAVVYTVVFLFYGINFSCGYSVGEPKVNHHDLLVKSHCKDDSKT